MNHSPEIERSVLGAILLDSRLAHEAATGLSVEDFYLDAHRKIFTAVLELVANGHPVELLALGEQLKRQGSLESVGGFSYLTSLSSDSIKRDSLAHYTRTLKEKSGLRYLANLSEQIHGWTEDQEGNTESIVGRIHQAIDALQGDAVRGQIRSAKEFMGATLRELETQAKCEGLIGLPTGIVGLDDATTGVRQGEL